MFPDPVYLLQLIREPDLKLAMALSEVCSASNFEDLSEIFLKIFDTPKSVSNFLKAIIEMEVSVTGKFLTPVIRLFDATLLILSR